MKKAQRKALMNKRIAIIKSFAWKMDYEILERYYNHCDTDRPCYSIELVGTYDSEGNPFAWAWYTDSYEEF